MSEPTIVISANAERVERVEASVFACISSTGPFSVIADTGDKRAMSTGRKFGNPGGEIFRRLRFIDTSGAQNTITFYAGLQDYDVKDVPNATLTTTLVTSTALAHSELLKTVTSAGTAVAVSAATLYCRSAIFLGRNAYTNGSAGDNVGDVYLGVSGAANRQPITIPSGGSYAVDGGTGGKLNLGAFFINAANAGDGIIAIYFQ